MALQQDVGLSWLIAVSVPLLLLFVLLIISRMVPLFRSFQKKLDAVNRVMREQLTGVRVVRAFVREDIEEERFAVANTDIMVVGRKVGSLFVLLFPLAMLVLNVTVVGRHLVRRRSRSTPARSRSARSSRSCSTSVRS